jgi:hypothetical protein
MGGALGLALLVSVALGGTANPTEVFHRSVLTAAVRAAASALVAVALLRLAEHQTGIILNTPDIDAAHAEMQSRGVDVDAKVARVGAPAAIRIGAVELVGPVPPMLWFRDPDGNALLLVESG